MLKSYLFKTIILLSIALFAGSCMRKTSLTVLKPAQITLPEHITAVAVVDRSKPSNGWLNALEGLFTGEAIGQDRRSRQEAVEGLTNALTRTPRFTVKSTGIEMEGSKAGNNLPAPMSWYDIEKICRDYGADAVATIESFDSDNSTSTSRTSSKKKDKNGKEYIQYRSTAKQRTGVRIGWRLYDPKKKNIIDEFVTEDHLERTASGDTDREATNSLPSQVSVTRDVAYNVGLEYGHRIAPIFVNIQRQFYAKAKGFKTEMKDAARALEARDLEKAGKTWNQVIARAGDNKKAKGRAAYNLAVAAEVNGSLELALNWAQKSYTDYGNKKARRYYALLKQRIYDAKKVSEQMPGKKV